MSVRWPWVLAASWMLTTSLVYAEPSEREQCAAAAEQAQRLRDAGRLLDARAHLVTCANTACPRVVRNDCTGWLARIENDIPTIVIRARDADGRDLVDVRVSVDGKPALEQLDGRALPLDPGKHVLRYEAAGRPPLDSGVLIAVGEKSRTILVTLGGAPSRARDDGAQQDHGAPDAAPRVVPPASSERPSGPPLLGYGLVALGIAAAASFTIFEVLGQNEYASMKDGCAPTHRCAQSEIDSARAKFLGAGVSLAVAGVALGAGALVLFTSKRATSEASVEVGPGSVRARIRF